MITLLFMSILPRLQFGLLGLRGNTTQWAPWWVVAFSWDWKVELSITVCGFILDHRKKLGWRLFHRSNVVEFNRCQS